MLSHSVRKLSICIILYSHVYNVTALAGQGEHGYAETALTTKRDEELATTIFASGAIGIQKTSVLISLWLGVEKSAFSVSFASLRMRQCKCATASACFDLLEIVIL